MNAIIETKELTRRFGKKEAVRNLNITVPEGTVFAFLGPNGAGKTTTIKMLMNLMEPSEGSAEMLGVDCRRLGPAELGRIGYVSENQKLPRWMTVRQMIAFCKPLYPGWDDAFCDHLLKQFDLPLDRKIRGLSRGMQIKAALLVTLAYRPRLLILDEPFSGLDALVRDEFIRGILELSDQENWTMFISSHDLDEVERLADWVGILHEGDLKLTESIESLQARFRRVDLTLAENAAWPAALPPAWLLAEQAGRGARFVDSAFDEARLAAEIQRIFPGSGQITATPLSLREIFLALARVYRLGL